MKGTTITSRISRTTPLLDQARYVTMYLVFRDPTMIRAMLTVHQEAQDRSREIPSVPASAQERYLPSHAPPA